MVDFVNPTQRHREVCDLITQNHKEVMNALRLLYEQGTKQPRPQQQHNEGIVQLSSEVNR